MIYIYLINIYTDISCNPGSKTSVAGYLIDSKLSTKLIVGMKNTEAEIRCIMELIDSDTIYTDLFLNPKFNKTLYAEFAILVANKPNVQLLHINEHKPKIDKTFYDLQFSLLDKTFRFLLRTHVKQPNTFHNVTNIDILCLKQIYKNQ